MGVGIDFSQGDISVTADFKQIKWGSAAGYKDFGWENQNVYAIGAEYRMDKLALRAGFNYAKNPIKNNTDATAVNPYTSGGEISVNPNTNGDTMNAFNHVMFPAVTERHYTIGAGYEFTKNVGADLAFMYATSPDVTVSAATVGLGQLTVTNDQIGVSANLNLKF
jgi:long-chain fatty acid transport protein